MEKALRIEAFRNIGFKDGKPHAERLVLSNSLQKGELGGLVMVIGANNSGKSNVLDALKSYGNGEISGRDVSDLYTEEECRKPKIGLSHKTDAGYGIYCYRYVYNASVKYKYLIDDKYLIDEFIQAHKELIELTPSYYSTQFEIDMKYTDLSIKDIKRWFQRAFVGRSFDNHYYFYEILDDILCKISDNMLYQAARKACKETKKQDYDYFNDEFCPKAMENFILTAFKFNAMPDYSLPSNVLVYAARKICGSEFEIFYSYEENNLHVKNETKNVKPQFLEELLASIDFDMEETKTTYQTFHNQMKSGKIEEFSDYSKKVISLQEELNNKLPKISDDFNKMYRQKENDAPYSFKITLRTDRIVFEIFRGGKKLDLEKQSTGFRWFFDFYFGFLHGVKPNPGDIIIMDEPATNLHPKGQKDIRDLLKEFAIQNDIHIVMATHSPFFIDLDFLDELRIIVNKDNVTSIVNNFAAVNPGDPDSLLPVLEAMTIENHVIVDPDKKIIFVEGITDYNYLTAFKKLFGKEEIIFLPVNGIGTNEEDNRKISKRLIEIRKHDPILLVDSDSAGNAMKELNKNSDLEVIALADVDNEWTEIESLFSDDDLTAFGLKDDEGNIIKHSGTSALFKKRVLAKTIEPSPETQKNFKALFDRLCE